MTNLTQTTTSIINHFVDVQFVSTFEEQNVIIDTPRAYAEEMFAPAIDDALTYVIPQLDELFSDTAVYIRSLFIANHHDMYDMNELELLFTARGFSIKILLEVESLVTEYTCCTISIYSPEDPINAMVTNTVLTAQFDTVLCAMLLNCAVDVFSK